MSDRFDIRRAFTVVRRVGRQIRRDRRTLGLLIVAPLFVTVIYAMMFTGSVTNVPLAVCMLDEPWDSKMGDAVVVKLEESDNVTVFQRNSASAFEGFGSSIQAVLSVPSDLTQRLVQGDNTTMNVYVNVTTRLQASYILAVIGNATADASVELLGRKAMSIDAEVTVALPSPPTGDLSFNVSVVNEDQGFAYVFGQLMLDELSADANVSVHALDDRSRLLEAIEAETVVAGVFIPQNFTETMLTAGNPSIEVLVNGIETTEVAVALGAVTNALSAAMETALGKGTDVDVLYVYGEAGMSMIELAGPSVIGFFALFFGFIISGVFFLRERQQGTLERVRASPLTDLEVIIGYVIAFIGVSIVQTTVITLVFVLYTPSILPAMGVLIPLVLLLDFGSVTLAMTASYSMKTELQVIQMIPIFVIPQIFLCGIFFPLSLLPPYLAFLPYLFPLTYYVMAVKAIVFMGATTIDILVPVIVLVAYSILGLVLAIVGRSQK